MAELDIRKSGAGGVIEGLGKKKSRVKLRRKLPPIESYDKQLEFRAEGSARVTVRLERLMGSDHVRLTDPRFMTTLLMRLEEEEENNWKVRSSERIEKEKNRSRDLAIEGLMEPTEDMQDLYHHPVFRVNKILKRLAKMDEIMSVGYVEHLPPIQRVEPFLVDPNGGAFKSYFGHVQNHVEEEPEKPSVASSGVDLYQLLQPEEEETEEEEETLDAELNLEGDVDLFPSLLSVKPSAAIPASAVSSVTTLAKLQSRYGIPGTVDLTRFETYKSTGVQQLYSDEGPTGMAMEKLYDNATDALKPGNEDDQDHSKHYLEKLSAVSEMSVRLKASLEAAEAEAQGALEAVSKKTLT